jgi:heat shock protein HslJ
MRIAAGLLGLCTVALWACAAEPPSGAAAPGAPSATLAGTRWVGVTADKAADPRTVPRLEFVREGRLSGFTGCNLLSGTWKMEGAEVEIGALATTKRFCAGPAGETERRFLAALREGHRGKREGNRLVFTAAGGERFEFVEAAAT